MTTTSIRVYLNNNNINNNKLLIFYSSHFPLTEFRIF